MDFVSCAKMVSRADVAHREENCQLLISTAVTDTIDWLIDWLIEW